MTYEEIDPENCSPVTAMFFDYIASSGDNIPEEAMPYMMEAYMRCAFDLSMLLLHGPPTGCEQIGILEINEEAADILGLDPEDFLGDADEEENEENDNEAFGIRIEDNKNSKH